LAYFSFLLSVQMSPTLKYLCIRIYALVGLMAHVDETELSSKTRITNPSFNHQQLRPA